MLRSASSTDVPFNNLTSKSDQALLISDSPDSAISPATRLDSVNPLLWPLSFPSGRIDPAMSSLGSDPPTPRPDLTVLPLSCMISLLILIPRTGDCHLSTMISTSSILFIWQPYTEYILDGLPAMCTSGRQEVWRSVVLLICFHIVEWHQPDRVLRQFGFGQYVPLVPKQDDNLHHLDLRSDRNWEEVHAPFLEIWNQRMEKVQQAVPDTAPNEYHSEYMKWYRDHTVRWLSPTGGVLVAVGDQVEMLRYVLTRDAPDITAALAAVDMIVGATEEHHRFIPPIMTPFFETVDPHEGRDYQSMAPGPSRRRRCTGLARNQRRVDPTLRHPHDDLVHRGRGRRGRGRGRGRVIHEEQEPEHHDGEDDMHQGHNQDQEHNHDDIHHHGHDDMHEEQHDLVHEDQQMHQQEDMHDERVDPVTPESQIIRPTAESSSSNIGHSISEADTAEPEMRRPRRAVRKRPCVTGGHLIG